LEQDGHSNEIAPLRTNGRHWIRNPAEFAGNFDGPGESAAQALQLAADCSLESIIDTWPRLTPQLRAAIVRLIEAV